MSLSVGTVLRNDVEGYVLCMCAIRCIISLGVSLSVNGVEFLMSKVTEFAMYDF